MFARYHVSTHQITDTYQKIRIDAKDAKVTVEPSADATATLILFEKESRPYEFFVQHGTLVIQPQKAKWYNALRVGIDRSEIRLRLPAAALEEMSVRATVGRVDIRSIHCRGGIDIRERVGSIRLEGVTCKGLTATGNTGSLSLVAVKAEESIVIKSNTGKVLLDGCSAPEIFVKTNTGRVLLDGCSAPEIFVKTNTGRVSGKLPHDMVFNACTNTGKIEIPNPTIGVAACGRCEIKTRTGSIKFE